jgi:hypothetical protein
MAQPGNAYLPLPCGHFLLQFLKPVRSDMAVPLEVFRLVHHAHHARANPRDGLAGTETCATREGHFFSPAVQLRTTVMGVDAVP